MTGKVKVAWGLGGNWHSSSRRKAQNSNDQCFVEVGPTDTTRVIQSGAIDQPRSDDFGW